MNQEKNQDANSPSFVSVLIVLVAVAFMAYLATRPPARRHHPGMRQRAEMTELVSALENFRTSVGQGDYPPSSNDDPDEVQRFLAKAFPTYHGGLPEKYK